jgi:hypothetical protein
LLLRRVGYTYFRILTNKYEADNYEEFQALIIMIFIKIPTIIFKILKFEFNILNSIMFDRLCGLVVRVSGYRSRGPGSIPGPTRFSEKKGVWNGVHLAS